MASSLLRPDPVAVLLILVAAVSLSGANACSSSDSSTCNDYSPPAGFDAQNPTVAFAATIMPVFASSCAFVSCHGSTDTSTNNGLYLGDTDPQKAHDAIVAVASKELASMPFVTAGDPRQSYLMRKLDGSQCALDAQCTGGSCQQSMPRNDASLPLDTRDAIRRWIAQGAKND